MELIYLFTTSLFFGGTLGKLGHERTGMAMDGWGKEWKNGECHCYGLLGLDVKNRTDVGRRRLVTLTYVRGSINIIIKVIHHPIHFIPFLSALSSPDFLLFTGVLNYMMSVTACWTILLENKRMSVKSLTFNVLFFVPLFERRQRGECFKNGQCLFDFSFKAFLWVLFFVIRIPLQDLRSMKINRFCQTWDALTNKEAWALFWNPDKYYENKWGETLTPINELSGWWPANL